MKPIDLLGIAATMVALYEARNIFRIWRQSRREKKTPLPTPISTSAESHQDRKTRLLIAAYKACNCPKGYLGFHLPGCLAESSN